jgi:hypothetical protein
MLQINNTVDVENELFQSKNTVDVKNEELFQFKSTVDVKSEESKLGMCLVLFTGSHMKALNF